LDLKARRYKLKEGKCVSFFDVKACRRSRSTVESQSFFKGVEKTNDECAKTINPENHFF
jgi:hypothetical protein